MAKAKETVPKESVPKTPEELESQSRLSILKRAQDGDEKTREAVKAIIAKTGTQGFTPVPTIARDALLKVMCPTNIFIQEDMKHQMRELHKSLAGTNPTALERLLVERIVLCWLHLHYYEILHAQNMDSHTLRQGEFHLRRIDGAHRRYLSAIKSLAEVRRLLVPTVQVNIGEKQLNIGEKQINVGTTVSGPPALNESGSQSNTP